MAIDTDAYEQMISTLQNYLSAAEEQCQAMDGAAADLSDNMEGDPHAAAQSESLAACVAQIRNALEGIQPIIQGLQHEVEQAQSAQ